MVMATLRINRIRAHEFWDLRRALPSAEKQGALRQTAAVGGYTVFTLTPVTGESESARSLLQNFTPPSLPVIFLDFNYRPLRA